MLGNQYFLARNFFAALLALEDALTRDPYNKSIRKKLIICYIKTGKTFEALDLFNQLINEDIYCIINTNPIIDDCPCPDIIYELETILEVKDEYEKNLALGMLWLYCDLKKSIKYFSNLPTKRKTETILKKLNAAQIQINQKEKNGK